MDKTNDLLGKHTGASRLHDKKTEIAICEYYWTRQENGFYPSYAETALAFDCTAGHVRNLLRRHGYESRTTAETREGRSCKPTNQPVGNAPLCACGCGEKTKWISKESKWLHYVPGHYRPKKLYHNAEWLRSEYVDKLRSIQEIANDMGVNQSTIIKSMNKHKIERRPLADSLILRGSVSGPNNPAWKGGVAKWEYASDWKRLCKQIKDRDEWTCQLCKERRKRWGHRLHVHHIDEDKTNNHPHNLISLCSACHAPIHGKIEIRSRLTSLAILNTQNGESESVG